MSNLESFKHRLAKELLVGWFREAAAEAGDGTEWWKCCGLTARPNRSEPWYGVFDEYPLTKNTLSGCVWDEDGWWTADYPSEPRRTWPDFEWMRVHFHEEFYIADIAIQHKGTISCVIEVVHTNWPSVEKLQFIKNYGDIEVVIVDAEWLLRQCEKPALLVPAEPKITVPLQPLRLLTPFLTGARTTPREDWN